ncbi:MAG: hypothetical protein ACTHK3_03780 [Solirubrobacterales bacterium]
MSESDATETLEKFGGNADELGGGAQFVMYVSEAVSEAKPKAVFRAHLRQGDWSGTVSSDQNPPILKTDGMSGIFQLKVDYSEPPAEFIAELIGPSELGCNENCFSMVKIDIEDGKLSCSTTWDAACKG